MGKLLKSHDCGFNGDLKTNSEENLTKHVGFVYAYLKKAKK